MNTKLILIYLIFFLSFPVSKTDIISTTEDSIASILESLNMRNSLQNENNNNQSMMDFEKYIISITTDANYNVTPEYSDAFVAFDLDDQIAINNIRKNSTKKNSTTKNEFSFNAPYDKLSLLLQQDLNLDKTDKNDEADKLIGPADGGFLSNLYGFIFKDDEENDDNEKQILAINQTANSQINIFENSITTSVPITNTNSKKNSSVPHIQNNTLPLSLIGILHNTKKDNPMKLPTPQRKNNKIIDPTGEPYNENTNSPISFTTPIPFEIPKNLSDKTENLSILRDVLLATLNHQSSIDRSDEHLPQGPLFLHRPNNSISPAFLSGSIFPALPTSNSIESKHTFQRNPIHSELDLIIPELNKNQASNDIGHNNYSPGNYHVLPNEPDTITNTDSYVINPVDLNKLKAHQSISSETKVFTPPSKDPAGILKLAGCNIYGRMYRVGEIIAELSRSCLECRCSEVGVSCSPLNC